MPETMGLAEIFYRTSNMKEYLMVFNYAMFGKTLSEVDCPLLSRKMKEEDWREQI